LRLPRLPLPTLPVERGLPAGESDRSGDDDDSADSAADDVSMGFRYMDGEEDCIAGCA
jgi:hypothetical protein